MISLFLRKTPEAEPDTGIFRFLKRIGGKGPLPITNSPRTGICARESGWYDEKDEE